MVVVRPYKPPRAEEVEDEDEDQTEPPALSARVISDISARPKKSVSFKEPPEKLARQLKDSTSMQQVLGKVLDQKVEHVTVRELIGMSARLHKAFFQSIPTDPQDMEEKEAPVTAAVNTYRALQSVPVDEDDEVVYAVSTLFASVSVNGSEVRSMVDTGAEINVMSESLVQALGLTMRPRPRVSSVMQNGEIVHCIGCCEDVPVQVGDIVTHVPMLVVPTGDRDFILGRPWQQKARLCLQTTESGRVNARIYSEDGRRYIDFVTYRPNRRNVRTGRHVWGPNDNVAAVSQLNGTAGV
jgi:predicted aspartyl protease